MEDEPLTLEELADFLICLFPGYMCEFQETHCFRQFVEAWKAWSNSGREKKLWNQVWYAHNNFVHMCEFGEAGQEAKKMIEKEARLHRLLELDLKNRGIKNDN